MKKISTICLYAILIGLVAQADAGSIQSDPNGNKMQTYAEDGGLMEPMTTLKSTTKPLEGLTAYKLYCPADSKYRLMPSSSKGTFVQHTVPGGVPMVRGVNKNSMYLNYSGACEFGAM